MDRRRFVAGILAGLGSGALVASENFSKPKLNVMLVGFCFSGAVAWDLKVSSNLWLDADRYDLSALVVASRAVPVQLFGRLARVPESTFRGYGDLEWVPRDLRGVDVAVVISDSRNEAILSALAALMRGIRPLVPMMIFVTTDPWTLSEPQLVPVRDEPAIASIDDVARLADLSFALSERPGMEAWSTLAKSLRGLPEVAQQKMISELDRVLSHLSRLRFDCLTAPVVSLFGRPDCRNHKPSTLLSITKPMSPS